MGVFKEQAHLLETLEKRQELIWEDSLDLGIYINDLSSSELKQLREAIKILIDLPGSKIVWKAERPASQRSYKLVIMWSKVDNKRYDATIYDVLYFKDRAKEYFSITSRHAFVNENGI